MTSEARRSIDNGIWVCADHGRAIDNDTVTYTAEILLQMKREHESRSKQALMGRTIQPQPPHDLVALGPDIVCVGDLTGAIGAHWRFTLHHFVAGAFPDLLRYSERATLSNPYDRYVVATSLGGGRSLIGPLRIERHGGEIIVEGVVAPDFPRDLAATLPTDVALSVEHDLLADAGRSITTVSGLDALPQTLITCLSMMRGESPFHPDYGSRLAEYWHCYVGSPWLNTLIKLDVARLASIPYGDPVLNQRYTPLRCVERVEKVEVIGSLERGRMPIRLELMIAGVGSWSRDLRILVAPMIDEAAGE